MKLTSINTLEEIKSFVHILMDEENLNFHPDTPFEDYIFLNNRLPVYSKKCAEVRNRLLIQAFEVGERLDIDTHELMCDAGLIKY